MRQTIEKIVDISRTLRITCNQTLFLLAFRESIYTIDLPGEELLELIQKGYLKGNKPTAEAMEKLELCLLEVKKEELERTKNNAQYPILNIETGQIVKRLGKHFHRGELNSKEFGRLSAYSRNPIAIPFLFIFLQMFPTSDPIKNKAWEKHFGENASRVTLRRMTAGTARKFQQIWKKKDIGLFLLGTYMFIKESYNNQDDKYYVSKIETYLSQWEHWYNTAEDMLESGELAEFTKRDSGKNKSSNTSVI